MGVDGGMEYGTPGFPIGLSGNVVAGFCRLVGVKMAVGI